MNRACSLVACAALLVVGAAGAKAETKTPISVSIRTSTSEVKGGSEVKLFITITNTSDQDVVLFKALGQDGQAEAVNKIDIRDEAGTSQPRIDGQTVLVGGVERTLPKRWMSRSGVTLKPGQNLEDFTVLSKLFDMTKPGKYTVTVRHEMRADDSGPDLKWLPVTSNTITVIVTP